jgi:hypothetical protein
MFLFLGAATTVRAVGDDDAVTYLRSRGIVRGYGDGAFHPERLVNHAEFLAMVMRAVHGERRGTCVGAYAAGIPLEAWYAPYVCSARMLGILSASRAFNASEHVVLGFASQILVYAYGIPVVAFGEQFDAYTRVLAERHAIPEGVGGKDAFLTRGDSAEILLRLKTGDTLRPWQTADDLGVATMHASPFDQHQRFAQEGDIRVAVDLGRSAVETDDDLRALIHIENEGQDDHWVSVYAVFDRDFTILSLSGDGVRLHAGDARWSDVRVRGGDRKTLSVLLRVARDARRNDTLGMRVIVEDEARRRSSASDETRVTRGHDDFDDGDGIDVRIETEDDHPDKGDTVTFTIRVENNEHEDVETDVRVEFDDDFAFVSASHDGEERSGNVVRWEDLEIDEGEEVRLRLHLRVESDADRGDDLTVRAEAKDDEGNDDEDEETVEVDHDGGDADDDLELSISVNDTRPRPGNILTYTIRVRNESHEDQDVDIDARFDSDLEFVDAYDGGDQEGSRRVEWDGILVRRGEEKSLTLHLQVDEDADDGDVLELRVTAQDEHGNRDRETRRVEVREE